MNVRGNDVGIYVRLGNVPFHDFPDQRKIKARKLQIASKGNDNKSYLLSSSGVPATFFASYLQPAFGKDKVFYS